MNNLKRLRQERGYSLEHCSIALEYEQLYITPDQLKKYEDMDVPLLDWKFWQKVADFWEVDLAYLLGLTQSKREKDLLNKIMDYEDYKTKVNDTVDLILGDRYEARKHKSDSIFEIR